jgi:phage terminase large subunit-like protein
MAPSYSDPDYDAEPYSPHVLRRLKISPEVGWYMATRGLALPAHPPLHKTPEPRKVAMFDAARVDRVLRVFHELRHTKGRLAGMPLDPDPWQVAYILAPIFGWVHYDDNGDLVRIITEAMVDLPRKNGKSTTAGGVGIYLTCSDNEDGAEVVAAASTKDQARFVFGPIKKLAETAPALRGKVKPYAGSIVHLRTDSVFKVVSSAGDAQHGANIHGAIVDELHVHKSPDLLETIETGTGSRTQPLVLIITTADSGKPNTIYARRREYVERLAAKTITDTSWYGVIFGVTEADDPFVETTWARANPGYPISPTRRYMQQEAKKAANSPAELAGFQRLHLGIRTKQGSRFILLKDWDRNAGKRINVDRALLRNREAYGGLDLASVSDITSLCWLLPRYSSDNGVLGYQAVWHNWIPENALESLDKRTANAASQWVKDGWLTTTEGDVTDYDAVLDRLRVDSDWYDVQSIGFDPFNATQLTNSALESDLPMVKVRQGFLTMSPPLKEVQRLLKLGTRSLPRIEHGGNPVVRWAMDNLAVRTDPAGNVKPDKENAGDKIDPVSALATAMSEAFSGVQRSRSAYDGQDSAVTFI